MSDNRNQLLVGICDNDSRDICLVRKSFETILRRVAPSVSYKISTFDKGDLLLEHCKSIPFDLVFLDIEMPEPNGFELAYKLNLLHAKTCLVFVSNHEGCVYDSFTYTSIGFVRKGSIETDMIRVMRKYAKNIEKRQFIYKTDDGQHIKELQLKDILYFESHGHTIITKTLNKEYSSHGSLKEIEETLAEKGFVRTHKSFLVNKAHIISVRQHDVKLLGGQEVVLAKDRRRKIREEMSTYECQRVEFN